MSIRIVAKEEENRSESRSPAAPPSPPEAPVRAAKAAGLRYVNDHEPGIRRERQGDAFVYRAQDGKKIRDKATLDRIRHLAIPPAYTDVWICPDPNGHIQATGRDAKGRKQYRYHPRWREVRDSTKYDHMVLFAGALPLIRAHVAQDLARPGMPKEKVLATVVRLLETTMIRVGNEEYVRQNHSYGLTTMKNRHVEVEGGTLHFHFRGKSGKRHRIDLKDRKLARIVRRCQEIPGQDLFEYLDSEGQRHTVKSSDVNEYLKSITGHDFTAKDFRTWAGTVLAALALQEVKSFDSQAEAKKNIVRAIEQVSSRLGNTPAVCRKCYVHPAVLDAYLEGATIEVLEQQAEQEPAYSLANLKSEEAAVLALLQNRLSRPLRKAG